MSGARSKPGWYVAQFSKGGPVRITQAVECPNGIYWRNERMVPHDWYIEGPHKTYFGPHRTREEARRACDKLKADCIKQLDNLLWSWIEETDLREGERQ